jgi:MFS family permease
MAAIFTCCIPMAMPQTHLVAFCSDLGINAAHGAAMVSVLLGAAFFSRQLWGLISDRIGGLYTMLAGSACQAVGMTAFLLTQDEVGLFTVAALFGFGFSGLVPANVLTSRELFPVEDAYWRMPTLLLCSGWGMAAGGWLLSAPWCCGAAESQLSSARGVAGAADRCTRSLNGDQGIAYLRGESLSAKRRRS